MWKRILWAWEDFKAWRRGERRVAPHGTTGRIYERKGSDSGGLLKPVEAKPEVVIEASVFRAATGQWEKLGVIAKGEVTEIKHGDSLHDGR